MRGFIQSQPHTLGAFTGHKRTQTQADTPSPSSPCRYSYPLPSHEPLTKARADFAESLARPLTPLCLLPLNDSKQETGLWAPKAEGLSSVSEAGLLFDFESFDFFFQSFICSLTHSTSKDVKQTILSSPVTWLSRHLAAWQPGLGMWSWGGKHGGEAGLGQMMGRSRSDVPIPYFFLGLSK